MFSPARLALLVALCLVICSGVDYQHVLRLKPAAINRTKAILSTRMRTAAKSMRSRTSGRWTTTKTDPQNSTLFNGTTVNGTTADPLTLLNGTTVNGATVASTGSHFNGATVAPNTKRLVRTRNWPTEPATVETTFFRPRPVTLPPHPTLLVYTIKTEDRFYEFDNSNVEDAIIIWLCFLLVGCLFGFLAIFGTRQYYKKITAEKLEDIRREFESQRQLDQLYGATNNQKPIEPLSDPVTDQAIYYPLGELLKEDAYGGVL